MPSKVSSKPAKTASECHSDLTEVDWMLDMFKQEGTVDVPRYGSYAARAVKIEAEMDACTEMLKSEERNVHGQLPKRLVTRIKKVARSSDKFAKDFSKALNGGRIVN